MTPTLNPDYELIYTDHEEDKVFLKNKVFKNIVSLSPTELEIIEYYVKTSNQEKVYAHYSQQYELSRDLIYALVAHAKASGLLATEDYELKKEKLQKASEKRTNLTLTWVVTQISRLLNWFGLSSTVELRGSFKYFRILSFNLKDTVLEKICEHKAAQVISIILYWTVFVGLITGFSRVDLDRYFRFYTGAPDQHFLVISLILFIGYFISVAIHELSHFIMYKKYGGMISEMGFALMLAIVPTPFISTSSLPLWKSRYKKVVVMGAGIMADLLVFMLCLYCGYITQSSAISFYAFIFLVMAAYRIIFNINPFLPRTDGHYIMCDFIGDTSFHSTAYASLKSLIGKIKSGKSRKDITKKEVLHSGYFCVSFLMIIINYLLLFIPPAFLLANRILLLLDW